LLVVSSPQPATRRRVHRARVCRMARI
jgi:hypothetical protein